MFPIVDFLSYRTDDTGINHGYEESNPLLNHVRRSSDLFSNPKSYLPDALGFGLSAVLPAYAIPVTIGKIACGISNLRVARRLNLAADIAESLPPRLN